ncbi:MAG: TetR/AcrR family transcriptional regulator [Yaniella sp.]|uniref:TetR/AcrR family transcriptional regulator n=1 Tax=Yaniella sp. TaxID=2773929 RepID=UPI00264A31E0|nr:TetR/AcrR family transcriptional regulator [Yaniella sp.]MDN5731636.1 TetR/AcrR family transcriptional regulator [Yaniella sp.]MDN5816283.1 TetR/AcrR family transcriptional regulator [Yaniella sp.]MDN5837488.1 TetR/AcrR family transcriptional regulator [Yaniella sp.]MDN5889707.1 TetR/AcrR family transcriptional regulator [Yaniella sp.]MDN5913124.1 TetR/AcrR family transcriptional regulator [Yaniella sp.]
MAQQDRSIATRASILEAAAKVFSVLPYSEAKISDVLYETSAGKGALYFHFKSKHNLASAVLLEGQKQLQAAAMTAIDKGDTARLRLESLTSTIASLIADSVIVSASFKLTMQAGKEFPDIAIDPYAVWQPMVRRLIDSASSANELRNGVDVDELTWIIISMFMGSKELLNYRGELTKLQERIEDAMSSLFGLAFK